MGNVISKEDGNSNPTLRLLELVKFPKIEDLRESLEHNRQIQDCIKSGADITTPDDMGRNSLHWAALNRHSCRRLIPADIDAAIQVMSAQDKNGDTPLHCCAMSGDWSAIQILFQRIISLKGDVEGKETIARIQNLLNNKSETALHVAVDTRALFTITSLAATGVANFDVRDSHGHTVAERADAAGIGCLQHGLTSVPT